MHLQSMCLAWFVASLEVYNHISNHPLVQYRACQMGMESNIFIIISFH